MFLLIQAFGRGKDRAAEGTRNWTTYDHAISLGEQCWIVPRTADEKKYLGDILINALVLET